MEATSLQFSEYAGHHEKAWGLKCPAWGDVGSRGAVMGRKDNENVRPLQEVG